MLYLPKNFGVLFFTFIFLVVESKCFNFYQPIVLNNLFLMRVLPFVFLFFLFFCKKIRINRIDSTIDKLILFLIGWPVITSIFQIVNEGFSGITISLSFCLTFAVIYIFDYYRVSEKQIMYVFLIFGCITAFIQIFQQMFPQYAFFRDEKVFFRNNLSRYYVGIQLLQIFCLFYCWANFLQKKKKMYLILFLLFCSSIYLYLTRQVLVAVILAVGISFFFQKGTKTKIFGFVATLCFLLLLFLFGDTLFSSFIELSTENTYSTDIREEAIPFFWKKSTENIFLFFLGHGFSVSELSWMEKGYYVSDIGFVGEIFHFGVFWAFAYFFTFYYIVIKKAKKVPLYLRLFIIGTAINSIFIFPYRAPATAIVWGTMLYISNLYINEIKR